MQMFCGAGRRFFNMWPLWFLLFSLVFAVKVPDINGINCYTCSSVNGSLPACEDPIDTSQITYVERCMVPKKGHVGLFPANFCLKIVGRNEKTYERLVIRACAMKTMDSQCGDFMYQEEKMSGCVLTCDYIGCNVAPAAFSCHLPLTAFIVPLIILLYTWPISKHVH